MVRAGLTTERVVAAAADLADSAGFDKVTISALARGFGVKDASLYSHVKNLGDLRTRVALLAAEEFIDRIEAAVAGRAGKDALIAFADAYRTFALEHPGRYAATRYHVDPAIVAEAPAYHRTLRTTSAMLRAYGLTDPDLTDAVRLLRSTFHGFTDLEAEGGFEAARPVQTSWERAVEGLHFLLSNWASATGAKA
ncbi:TetR/AcrR family transcriptional regulator [Streptomyces drozdowiczii]|uniref:WHG domain-containing protein n=1 Tax=Streptomyces drozdowiczii TaxID=202862 RepID=A0ABY6PM11_9ACTN|nr:TetR-like C-terminal domain-containing protein [Streptomyces drozdowiczii]MCX0247414.1 WHG domain-containing protein [Streptomyces drozdowiczii]UZK53185.1 WHG domain-containing protein [Streptomyces drozdowiczii]